MNILTILITLYITTTIFVIGERKYSYPTKKFSILYLIPVFNFLSLIKSEKKSIAFPLWIFTFYATYCFSYLLEMYNLEDFYLAALMFFAISFIGCFVSGYKFVKPYIENVTKSKVLIYYFSCIFFFGLPFYGLKRIIQKKPQTA